MYTGIATTDFPIGGSGPRTAPVPSSSRPVLSATSSSTPPLPVTPASGSASSGLSPTTVDGATVPLSGSTLVARDDLLSEVLRRLQDPSQSIMAVEDVSQDGEGLQKLMRRGAWKSVLRLASTLISTARYPHHKLRYRLARIIGMTKLRMLTNAFNEFADIGKIDDPKNLFETYPDLYPNKKGSMVPFTLRHLYAEISFALGRDPTMEGLYSLRSYCSKKLEEAKALSPKTDANTAPTVRVSTQNDVESLQTNSPDPLAAISPTVNHNIFLDEYDEDLPETWIEREQRVVFSLITKLTMAKEFVAALQLCNSLLESYPTDPILLSCCGRIALMMGASNLAKAFFNRVERTPTASEHIILMQTNRGLLAVANDQMQEAVDCFSSILSTQPNNSVAANNLAMCYLHLGNATKAIEILEELLFGDPDNMHESVVGNLVSLYDLSSERPFDKRKKIIELIKDHARDDFNVVCLKLPNTST